MSSLAMEGPVLAEETVFFLCDMQEKFAPTICCFKQVLTVCRRMYPKGLGHTVSELDISHATKVVEKTKFSMLTPEISEILAEKPELKTVVMMGIEAHVCIQQTVLELLAAGYRVHVLADACSSRNNIDRMFAYKRLRKAGAVVTTNEATIFQLLGDKNHPKFKEVQALVKTLTPDSGLWSGKDPSVCCE